MSTAPFNDLPRIDALEKVRGTARFGTDEGRRNMLHAALATSTICRGSIESLDTSDAARQPGVRLILSHENLGKVEGGGFLLGGGYAFQSFQPMLSPRIAYRGQPIALVVADTLEIATDAASRIRARYTTEAFAPTMDSAGTEVIVQAESPLPKPMFADTVTGDAPAAFAAAQVKLDAVYRSPPQHQNPMELIGTVAEWNGDKLVIYEGTQNSGAVRFGVARQLGISPEQVHVISPYVGGGFGQKNSLQMQTVLAALAAKRLGRPVKLVLRRSQVFHGASFRPASVHRIRLGADAQGKITAALHDADAQTSRHDLFPCEYTQLSARLHGIRNFRGFQRLVRTDVQTPGYMRAPFEHAACFAFECGFDELAYALNQDPVALRLANDTENDPVSGLPLSSRHMAACLRRGMERFGWQNRTMKPMSMRAGDGSYIGWGVASGAYPGTSGPNIARLKAGNDGRVTISAGVHEMGQGIRTVLTAVVARKLDIQPESVAVSIGDTRAVPQHLTAGSWGTAMAVSVAEAACDALIAEISRLAPSAPAHATLAQKLTLAKRREVEVQVQTKGPGQPDAVFGRLTSGQVAVAGPDYPEFVTFSYIAHFVEVRVEPSTRRVRVARVVSVADCGRVVSPRTAASQVRGGVVWGVSAALREISEVDPRYGGFLNADIAEYVIPVNADVPPIDVEFIDEPDPRLNGIGAKGLGEVAMAGVAPAVANAIFHATGRRVRELPIRIEHLI